MNTYDLHGYLTIALDSEVAAYRRYFDNEYARVHAMSSGTGTPKVRVTVHIVEALPAVLPGDLAHSIRFKKLFTFAYLVRGLKTDDVHLYFRRHPVDMLYVTAIGVFLQAQVLEPILYYKLLGQDVVFMHAAAVTDGTQGSIFPAHGGTGKTTLSLRLADRGFELLGDDLVIVDPARGLVHPHPRPLHLFNYNLKQMRDRKLPLSLKAVIHTKDVMRVGLETALRTEFLISTRAHVDGVMPEVRFGKTVPYKRIAFLTTRRPPQTVVLDTDAKRADVARTIVESADLNGSLYQNVLTDPTEIAATKAREVAVVMKVLARLESMRFVNPRAFTAGEFDAFAAGLRA